MKGGGNPLCKAALFFFLTDESFSVASLQSGGAVSVLSSGGFSSRYISRGTS